MNEKEKNYPVYFLLANGSELIIIVERQIFSKIATIVDGDIEGNELPIADHKWVYFPDSKGYSIRLNLDHIVAIGLRPFSCAYTSEE